MSDIFLTALQDKLCSQFFFIAHAIKKLSKLRALPFPQTKCALGALNRIYMRFTRMDKKNQFASQLLG